MCDIRVHLRQIVLQYGRRFVIHGTESELALQMALLEQNLSREADGRWGGQQNFIISWKTDRKGKTLNFGKSHITSNVTCLYRLRV